MLSSTTTSLLYRYPTLLLPLISVLVLRRPPLCVRVCAPPSPLPEKHRRRRRRLLSIPTPDELTRSIKPTTTPAHITPSNHRFNFISPRQRTPHPPATTESQAKPRDRAERRPTLLALLLSSPSLAPPPPGEPGHGAGGGGEDGGAAGAAPGAAGGAHPDGAPPPLLARPLPDPDGAHRVAARLQARPGAGRGQPGDHHRARPVAGARRVLPARGAPRRVRRRWRPPRRLQRRGRLVHRGRRAVPPRGRRLPRVPAPDPQGRPAPAPAPAAQPRGGEQAHPPRPGDHVRVRRLRGGVPVQPRGGGRSGRGQVHGRGGGAGARGGPDLAAPDLGPRRHPRPVRRARRQPPRARRRQAPRVPGHRHLRRLHRPLQVPVRGGVGRGPVLRVRGAHRQGVAEPHPRRVVRAGDTRPPLLRHERAPAPRRPPPARRRRVLRQLLLHHARLIHGREGLHLVGHRRGEDHQGGEEASAVGVRAVGGGGGGRRPVPDHLRLPDAAGVGLDAAGLRRGGLRVGPSGPRGAADEPGLHRHVHPRQAVGPQARGAAHHAVRDARPRRRLPRRHGGHELLARPHLSNSICSWFFFSL